MATFNRKLINSELTDIRPVVKTDSIKFENKDGDIMVFTPKEAKEVLKQYIADELELYADHAVKRDVHKISEIANKKIKLVEEALLEHINTRFDEICEKIVDQTIERKINAEVERRLEIKESL